MISIDIDDNLSLANCHTGRNSLLQPRNAIILKFWSFCCMCDFCTVHKLSSKKNRRNTNGIFHRTRFKRSFQISYVSYLTTRGAGIVFHRVWRFKLAPSSDFVVHNSILCKQTLPYLGRNAKKQNQYKSSFQLKVTGNSWRSQRACSWSIKRNRLFCTVRLKNAVLISLAVCLSVW